MEIISLTGGSGGSGGSGGGCGLVEDPEVDREEEVVRRHPVRRDMQSASKVATWLEVDPEARRHLKPKMAERVTGTTEERVGCGDETKALMVRENAVEGATVKRVLRRDNMFRA